MREATPEPAISLTRHGQQRGFKKRGEVAIYYDHRMRMGSLAFDQQGNCLLPEATQEECERMRKYKWLAREGRTITVKADLAAVWDQIGRWPANRELKRTFPQLCCLIFPVLTKLVHFLVCFLDGL